MKKLLKFILISVISVCVLVVAAGYILLTQIDFNAYKNSIIKIVYEKTGRQLTMDNIQLKPSFNPVVEVQNVTFSNAKWSQNPEMVSAQSIELGFALLPLFHKKIEIDTFTVHDAVVNLEMNAQGKANWEFSDAKSNESGDTVILEAAFVAFTAITSCLIPSDIINVVLVFSGMVSRSSLTCST